MMEYKHKVIYGKVVAMLEKQTDLGEMCLAFVADEDFKPIDLLPDELDLNVFFRENKKELMDILDEQAYAEDVNRLEYVNRHICKCTNDELSAMEEEAQSKFVSSVISIAIFDMAKHYEMSEGE